MAINDIVQSTGANRKDLRIGGNAVVPGIKYDLPREASSWKIPPSRREDPYFILLNGTANENTLAQGFESIPAGSKSVVVVKDTVGDGLIYYRAVFP